MSISPELLRQIIGSPDSVTAKLVAMRKTPGDAPLETGVWYSDFTRVKTEAERRGLPFFAMWTNGDMCGFCRRFTANVLDPYFVKVMRESKALWWLGGSMDDSPEDGRDGVGYQWCQGPAKAVGIFPFFAVYHSADGKVTRSFFGSGHDFDQRIAGPDGSKAILAKIGEVFGVQPPHLRGSAPATKAGQVLHIRFNPRWDTAHIVRFQKALKENGGHCLCQSPSPDTMCTCKAFLAQDRPGLCHCGAFEKYTV